VITPCFVPVPISLPHFSSSQGQASINGEYVWTRQRTSTSLCTGFSTSSSGGAGGFPVCFIDVNVSYTLPVATDTFAVIFNHTDRWFEADFYVSNSKFK
jgi:hypothetical protein